MSALRHFLDISEFSGPELRGILETSKRMKQARAGAPKGAREVGEPLKDKVLALIFERPSTRTRVSFEVGMRQLGGDVLLISASDMQLGRGETVADTAKVLSRYVDAIMLRAAKHSHLTELAAAATVPVINGLTDQTHPCQVLADIQTFEEHVRPLEEATIAWVGDANNVAASWIQAVTRLGGTLRLGCPEPLMPPADLLRWARDNGADIQVTNDPRAAVKGAQCVITDAWASMHDTDVASRHNMLIPYQVDVQLMSEAAPGAKFMHCLPVHRGEEATDAVIDSSDSLVFDEAENRLHVQKAILLHCFGSNG